MDDPPGARGVHARSSPGADGTLAVEIGAAQGDAVRALFDGAGLRDVNVLHDYAGLDRIVLGTR